MDKFKEYSASVLGGAIGLGLLWFFTARDFNPITLPYEAARWGFNSVASYVGATAPERVWLVVRFTRDGAPGSMSFDNPDAPDMTLAECEKSKGAAIPHLVEHISSMTEGSVVSVLAVECIASVGDPVRP